MSTEPTNDIATTPGTPQPMWAIQPTTSEVMTPWYEVFAANDPRGGPTSVGVMAVDEVDFSNALHLANSIEIKGPEGFPIRLCPDNSLDFLTLAFACEWRINKSWTDQPVGYVVFGYSAATSVSS